MIAETLMFSSNPTDALLRKGYRGFPQALIARNCHLSGLAGDSPRNGGVECRHGKASRSRPFPLAGKSIEWKP